MRSLGRLSPRRSVWISVINRRIEARAYGSVPRGAWFLSDESRAGVVVDCVLDNYIAAVWLLERRAKGDHEPDERPNQFPKFSGRKPVSATGHTPWKLFEGWVAAKMPNGRTVGRWRVVFEDLVKFPDAGSVSEDDAQAWVRGLVVAPILTAQTPQARKGRSARTVKDVWVNAAHTVFG